MSVAQPHLELPPLVAEIRPLLPDPQQVWVVGGAVRDVLLGRPVCDVDLAVPRGALALGRCLADRLGGAFFALDAARGCGRVVLTRLGERHELDVADFRAATLEGDLRERDFTINAMANCLDPTGGLVDPTGGAADLERRLLRAAGPRALEDDPLRALRAVRLAAELGFGIEARTENQIRRHSAALSSVSPERIRDELVRILLQPGLSTSLRRLAELDLLPLAVPGIGSWPSEPRPDLSLADSLERIVRALRRPEEEAFDSSAGPEVLQRLLADFRQQLAPRLDREPSPKRPVRGLLLLASLWHGQRLALAAAAEEGGSLDAERRAAAGMRALRFSRFETRWVARAVGGQDLTEVLGRPEPLREVDLHRFFRATGEIGPEACLLALASARAREGGGRPGPGWGTRVERARELLDAFFFRYEEVVAPPPLVDGRVLIREVGLTPGPAVGRLLAALQEAQATGEVRDRDHALRLARHLAAQNS